MAPPPFRIGGCRHQPRIKLTFIWTAPDIPGTFTIVARPSASSGEPFYNSHEKDMTVIVPNDVKLKKGRDWTNYKPTYAGVGFTGIINIYPMSVSFADIETKEGEAPPITSGFFDRPTYRKKHPEGNWVGTDDRNKAGPDDAATVPPGYQPVAGSRKFKYGIHAWQIPWFYQSAGGSAAAHKFLVVDQTFVMTGKTGQMTVSKGDWAAVRTPQPNKPKPVK